MQQQIITSIKSTYNIHMKTDNYLVYVEDDEDDLMLMEEIMNKYKEINLVTVSDGQELLHFLEDQRDGELPCLVIMDNNTPRMSGIETARQLKQDALFSKLPLIIITTSASRTDADFCTQNNITLITKPSTYPDWEALSQTFIQHCKPLS